MRLSGAQSALLSQADSFKPLAVMRVIMGGVLVIQALILWKYRSILLDPQGPVPWSLSDTWIHPVLPKLSHLLEPFAAIGLGPASVISLVLALHAIAAAFFMVGYKTRVSAVIAWATLVLIQDSACAFTYGIGAMLLIALFYSLFMPVGREWSVDRMLQPAAPVDAGDASLCVMVFRLHLCIIYAAAAVAKAVGDQWWTGEAVWRALSLPQFQQFDPSPLAAWPGLLAAVGIATVVSQLAYPLLVWTRLRVPIVVLVELTHLGIALFLGLWLFSLAMIALNTAAFGQALWKALSTRLPARPAERPRVGRLEVIYDGACPFCNDYVRYQELQASASMVELIDARAHPESLAAHDIRPSELEDGMVVIADGRAYRGADAVHLLSKLSGPPASAWVRAVAAISRSQWAARLAYPPMRLGRRVALAFLRIPRFTAVPPVEERAQRD